MTKYGAIEPEFGETSPILQTSNRRCKIGISARHSFAFLSSIGFFMAYAMRVNLSVAIVSMVIPAEKHSDLDTTACAELLPVFSNGTESITSSTQGEFDWSSKAQGNVLAAFFFGYVITQIPGGIIAEKYGAKWLFGIGILVTSVFTLLTPVAARMSFGALLTVRVIEGLGEGVTFPAMNALIGRWAPKSERSRIATIIYTGSPFGTVAALIISGFICSSDSLGGWPMVFYFFGVLGCIWCFFWIAFVYESPEVHPRISKEELEYIRAGQDPIKKGSSGKTPWSSILTSGPVWTLVITHFGFNWGFYTLLTELPTYISNILHYDIKENGFLSAAPYVCQAIFAYLASIIADRMRASERYRITCIRKFINSIAFYLPGLLVGSIAFIGCQSELIIICIVASVAFSGFMYSGFNVTHVDMSPEFAGTLMGITNCVANLSGFLAPIYVGWVTDDGHTVHNWAIVFLTATAVYFVSGTIYNIFASAELQPWGVSAPLPHDLTNDIPEGEAFSVVSSNEPACKKVPKL